MEEESGAESETEHRHALEGEEMFSDLSTENAKDRHARSAFDISALRYNTRYPISFAFEVQA